ncbi:hypothetical protein N9137_03185 [Pseudomonadales bacterium]|nr:hypothetical protein [Pseudomonadales bacterium]
MNEIDTQSVNEQFDLVGYLESLVQVNHNRKYTNSPCPMCGGDDRFVTKDNTCWLCRKCNPTYQDPIALVMACEKYEFVEACNFMTHGNTFIAVKPKPKQRTKATHPPKSWQNALEGAAMRSHEYLLGLSDKDRVWVYLKGRGWTREMVSRHKIGFNPSTAWNACQLEDGSQCHLHEGLTIPRWYNDHLRNVNVRLTKVARQKIKSQPKYLGVKGYTIAPFVAGQIESPIIVVCEGEFDAGLIFDRTRITTITLGASAYMPDEELFNLLCIKNLYTWFDGDEAGGIARSRWVDMFPNVEHIETKGDATDYWIENGDERFVNLVYDHVLF